MRSSDYAQKDNVNLEYYRAEATKAAKHLKYDSSIIYAVSKAKSEIEITRLMKKGRCMKWGYI